MMKSTGGNTTARGALHIRPSNGILSEFEFNERGNGGSP
jgi:hypothetical protein